MATAVTGTMMTLTDDIIRDAADGDRVAQQSVYESLSQRIFHLVRRIVGHDDAEDVTQDVFLNIFRKMHSFQFDASFATWAYRLAVNDALQHLRRQRRTGLVGLEQPAEVVAPPPPDADMRELLERGLAELEPELRIILQLKEVDRLSYEQIAEVLSIPTGTVGSRLNRARRELRQELQRLGWEG